jgi:hypothetical protein
MEDSVARAIGRKARARIAAGVVVVAAALVAPAIAQAGLLTTNDQVRVCDPTQTQAFSAWDDEAYYMLTPGGAFEGGGAWTLAGGARVVSGNEPFYVHATADSHSLLLPPGSSALTPAMCFAPGDWHLRLFAVNTGSQSSGLKVTVVVRSLCGLLTILDGGTIQSTGTWQPSGRLSLALTNLTGLIGTNAVSFRFTPTGWSSSWQIDDVYLDPFKST